jgi:hypothetical protein
MYLLIVIWKTNKQVGSGQDEVADGSKQQATSNTQMTKNTTNQMTYTRNNLDMSSSPYLVATF